MMPKLKLVKIFASVILISLVVIILLDILNIGEKSNIMKLIKLNKDSEEFLSNIQNNVNKIPDFQNKESSIEELFSEFQNNLPNVPFSYSLNYNNQTKPQNNVCAMFPSLKLLNYYNNYWQTYHIENVTIQLYGAYYDERTAQGQFKATVRILAMINQITAPFPRSYCQLWFDNDREPVITTIKNYKLIWMTRWGHGVGIYYPYLMTCDMPSGERIPKAVTIVQRKCDMSKNALTVIYDKPKEKLPFAVCVKGLDYPFTDISARLVEWLEMMRILGASKVYFHHIATHTNVMKVLSYYQQLGFIELQAISSINGIVGIPHLQHWLVKPNLLIKRLDELIPYNQCFYRNIYKYDYIALSDIDEVIMPLGNRTSWHDLVEDTKIYENLQKCVTALCVQNIYFPYSKDNFSLIHSTDATARPSEIPSYMFMSKRPYRLKNHSPVGINTKCLHNTEQALTLHNHYPRSSLNGCRPKNLPNTTAQLQHYHDIHPDKKIQELVLDNNIERFESVLIEKTTKVLKNLRLL